MAVNKKKPPKLGDYIIHREPAFNRENAGEVVQLLAMQFVYETAEGHVRHCMFRENWDHTERAKYEQSGKNDKISKGKEKKKRN